MKLLKQLFQFENLKMPKFGNREALNRIVVVQECDATMMNKEQMLVTPKVKTKKIETKN